MRKLILQMLPNRKLNCLLDNKIDLMMCYYTYELDKESANLCVIITPFQKFRYLCLPMRIKQSPNFAQEIIKEVLCGLEECEVYIDDIGTAFNNDWALYLRSLDQVLQ